MKTNAKRDKSISPKVTTRIAGAQNNNSLKTLFPIWLAARNNTKNKTAKIQNWGEDILSENHPTLRSNPVASSRMVFMNIGIARMVGRTSDSNIADSQSLARDCDANSQINGLAQDALAVKHGRGYGERSSKQLWSVRKSIFRKYRGVNSSAQSLQSSLPQFPLKKSLRSLVAESAAAPSNGSTSKISCNVFNVELWS